jgi:serine/threonine protein kinase
MSELKLQQCRLDGRYDIIECLGRGSYAEIYVARDRVAQAPAPQTVVIKALNIFLQGVPDNELERTLIENFQNEAIALDRVRHPNIINRLGHGTAIDLSNHAFHYLVLEYMSGGDLAAFCRKQPLKLETALLYIEQVCAGLAHAHSKGVIHRDIKPQNLLLTADLRTLKITDFGVAKIGASEGVITRVGTDVYAAPEHNPLMRTGPLDTLTNSRQQLTPAADIYSLGKTAYMLLCGESPRRFAQRQIEDLPDQMQEHYWASSVLRVLKRATEHDPEQRYQSVQEFWEELRDATLVPTLPLKPIDNVNLISTVPETPKAPAYKPILTPTSPQVATKEEVHSNSSRPRIVVPIGTQETVKPPTKVATSSHSSNGKHKLKETKESRPVGKLQESSRFKWAIFSIGLIVFLTGVLFATHRYVQRQLRPNRPVAQPEEISPIGREFITTTDLNLRTGPGIQYDIIGVAENGSRVKVLSASDSWYEVMILEHGRAKENPSTADSGWLTKKRLIPK